MLLDFSEGCHSPVTVNVTARTRMVGLYEIAVWKYLRSWYWLVSLNGEEKARGKARLERAADAAADAALRRLT